MSGQIPFNGPEKTSTVGLDAILRELSSETVRLAEQCGVIQWSISTILETAHHPDLGAEIHMLQDVDRIQQTLSDIARIILVATDSAAGTSVDRAVISEVIRLESLRRRLGLSDSQPGEAPPSDPSEITWL